MTKVCRERVPQVWGRALKIFREMTKIPRGSGNTDGIVRWLMNFAEKHGLEYQVDNGNIILYRKSNYTIVLQGHIDMVCAWDEKYQTMPPIILKKTNGWYHGDGTSIGADNGLGVAIALAIITSRTNVGPIAVLCTTDEEVGMYGAKDVVKNTDWLDGVNCLINLDTEMWGTFYIGCAGGRKVTWTIPAIRKATSGTILEIKLSGLRGGHSAVEIDGSTNANSVIAEFLSRIHKKQPFWLEDIKGGQFDGDKQIVNAIPKAAMAKIVVNAGRSDDFKKIFEEIRSEFLKKYNKLEPNFDLTCNLLEDHAVNVECVSKSRTREILNHIRLAITGLQSKYEDSGELRTSLNLSNVQTDSGHIIVTFSIRSSENDDMDQLVRKIKSVGDGQFTEDHGFRFPLWEPKPESEVVWVAKTVFEEMFAYTPSVEIIHGGLEPGVFFEKYPSIQYIAMGSTIKDVHTSKERFEQSSARKFAYYLFRFVMKLNSLANVA